MRLPLPQNRLVALTLAGALLTTVVAAGLTAPGLFGADGNGIASSESGDVVLQDAPTPNENFTPAVQTQSGGEHEEEWEEHEGDDDDSDEHEDESEEEEHEDDD